jgi:pimeloyl-ACP methyl ester carboxylesterase
MLRWLLIPLTVLLITLASVQADYIFLKDGFVLQGTLFKEFENLTDEGTGQSIPITKLGGIFFVDDKVRRTYFPKSLWAETNTLDSKLAQEVLVFSPANRQWHPGNSQLKPFVVNNFSDWLPDGSRTMDVYARNQQGLFQVDQKIDRLSPTTMEVITRRYTNTRSSFLTREFPADKILAMVRQRIKDEVKEQKRTWTVEDHLRIASFAAQAGWYDEALAEFNTIAKEMPTELAKAQPARLAIERSHLKVQLEEIDEAIANGQHQLAQNALANLKQDAATVADLTKLSSLRASYKHQNGELARLQLLFAQVRQKQNNGGLTPLLDDIERNLNLDTYKSLSVFLKMAEQEERLANRKQPSVMNPEQLLALAITGWLQGPEAADSTPATAQRLVKAREMLLQFLLADEEGDRTRLLREYLAVSPLKADEAVQLIEHLPPARAEKLDKAVFDLKTPANKHWAGGVKYRVYLPPEYHHYRSYPVLFVVPNFFETYENATVGWLEPALRKGFLVVVPEWVEGKVEQYAGGDKEHDAVLETLRDIRRRFRIDSNRVSLAGYSNGGNLVFDVALTRPHLFASAAVINGQTPPDTATLKYNAQYLPFYIVDGTRNPYREKQGSAKRDALMQLFEYWMPKGYPSLFVEYQGRGFEHFHAEKPIILDWMSRKKRAAAMPEMGKADLSGNRLGQEFRIVRPSAHRFYWIESFDHNPTNQQPTLVSGGWEKDVPNSLRCVMNGMKRARIWLNSSMVNYENPVEIRVQGPPGSVWAAQFKQKLEPSVAVLLEDYYQRGDSKNLFTQCVDLVFKR